MKLLLKLTACIILGSVFSFKKIKDEEAGPAILGPASAYSTDVLDQWMAMQIRLMGSSIASFNGPFVRIFSYSSIAAYASVSPGISKNSPWWFSTENLDQFPVLPKTEPGKKYHWPSSLNAALAFMCRAMVPSTNAFNKTSVDSLENLLNKNHIKETDSATVSRSAAFGIQIAEAVFAWSETDGYRFASTPYTTPAGPGKWVPTPPSFSKAVTPYWGNLRTIVKSSMENSQPPAPPPYSEDPSSDFYKMIEEVYDLDQHMNKEQKDIAIFWRDINPGITAPGHWLNVLRQVFKKEKGTAKLDKGVFAFALSGMALNDSWISCWKTRYTYNLLRPVTYIRNVMGHKDWLPLITTPPHPEYTAGFAAMAGAVTQSLTTVFGDHYRITDHTYDQYGIGPRSFDSFEAMGQEASDSKLYGGIHYRISVDRGLWQGRTVAKNIRAILQQKENAVKP